MDGIAVTADNHPKKKPGRPSLGENGMSKRVSTRLTPKEYELLTARCARDGVTLATALRAHILRSLSLEEEGESL